MKHLPIDRRYCGGEIAARFASPLSVNDTLLLGIPGGPGLGGTYLDSFLREVAESASCNAGMLDLPNHGASHIRPDRGPISYLDALAYTQEAVTEVSRGIGRLVLFGQSFGARLVYDMLADESLKPAAIILAGFPYKFESSSAFYEKLGALPLEPLDTDVEERFARNWRKILRLNIHADIAPTDFEAICSGTKWTGNEKMLERVPAIEALKSGIAQESITIIEGQFDPVVPDRNLQVLTDLLPRAAVQVIPKAGHFPMIERHMETLQVFRNVLSQVGSR